MAGTGGLGGPLWPTDGLRASIDLYLYNTVCGQLAGGGGGAGFIDPGEAGEAVQTFELLPTYPEQVGDLGPDSVGGVALLPESPPDGVSSLDHYLVGGAGGGGGGSQPLFMDYTAWANARPWNAGMGGCGGAYGVHCVPTAMGPWRLHWQLVRMCFDVSDIARWPLRLAPIGRSVRRRQRRQPNCPRRVGPPRADDLRLRTQVDWTGARSGIPRLTTVRSPLAQDQPFLPGLR